jgi:two-component system, NarL family, sensor kinase
MRLHPRPRTMLAWALWLVTMGCCAAGLVVALLVARPLTAQVLLDGGLFAVGGPLGYATIGLVLTLRRPANPIGWLYAASALTWSLIIPLDPWLDQLVRDQRPLSLLAQLVAVAELTIWAPAIALGVTLPALLVPDGRLRSPRWRVVAATAVAGPAMFVVGVFLIPGPTSDTPVPFDNPLGQSGLLGQLAKGMVVAGLALHVASLLARPALRDPAVAGLAGVERQQLRWVATGATIAVLGVTVLWASSGERGSTRW